jgi:subtilisin family serine protease
MPEHIILSLSRAHSRDTLEMFPKGLKNTELKYKLEFENITSIKAAELTKNNPEILVAAPSIPIELIKPFKAGEGRPLANGSIAWGVKAVGAHTSPYTGRGVTMAILDTGIDRNHEAFAGMPAPQLIERDFTSEGNGDADGHGTHVAGTVFGRETNGKRIGVAPGVEHVLIGKVLGQTGGNSKMVADAITWAIGSGANIISMSLGIDFPGYVRSLIDRGRAPEHASSIALEGYRKNITLFEKLIALIRAQAQGGYIQPVIIVAAAGNESQRPSFEIAVSPPAVSDGIISVGALGKNHDHYYVADFSNTGPVVSGPGVDIQSAQVGGGLTPLDGTSMAAPHVAGVAALWAERLMRRGQFNMNQFAANITAYCSDDMLQNEKPIDFGAGMVQAPQE